MCMQIFGSMLQRFFAHSNIIHSELVIRDKLCALNRISLKLCSNLHLFATDDYAHVSNIMSLQMYVLV